CAMLQCARPAHCALHSFPTRRSSDLYIGSDTIEVKGGAGGLANNDGTLNRCYGGGGGGSGGVIYFSGSIPAVIYDVSGGAAGPEDRKSTRLNSSHVKNSYVVYCLNKK